jgi:hypothetical protein
MTAATIEDRINSAEPVNLWPAPRPLPKGLLPVLPFPDVVLPEALRAWVLDVAERMQTPVEYVAVPAIISAGSVIGRKVGIRPQQNTDWQETPNLWGCIIGRPGVMKSPAVKAAFKPLQRLVALASENHHVAKGEYDAGSMERDLRKDAARAAMKKALSADTNANVGHLRIKDDEEPVLRRYVTNDCSYQALGELLRHNTNGLLVHRDELMSLLRALDREDNSEARGFFLTGWNGSDSYTFDRIGRGSNIYVPSLTLSLMGSTQPGLLQNYVRSVMGNGASDDGLLQRFGMMVWPDLPPTWVDQDREPNPQYRNAAFAVYDHLDRFTADDVSAQQDTFEKGNPYLRLHEGALAVFREWRGNLEQRVRDDDNPMHPAMESHLAKYKKLVPALALIHHLASRHTGQVSERSMLSALGWAEYLESHAQRIYAAGLSGAVEAATAILRHMRAGDLQSGFGPRDIVRRNWANIGEDTDRVNAALEVLEDHYWVRGLKGESGPNGGRPTIKYAINPKVTER